MKTTRRLGIAALIVGLMLLTGCIGAGGSGSSGGGRDVFDELDAEDQGTFIR